MRISELFTQSRYAVGTRSIRHLLQEEGIRIGWFKVRTLMSEMGLVSKQPGTPAYHRTTMERPDIPTVLDRTFKVLPQTSFGMATLPTSGHKANGITLP